MIASPRAVRISLPDLHAEGQTAYAAVQAIRDRINGSAIHKLGPDHYAISTHGGTGLCQIILKSATPA